MMTPSEFWRRVELTRMRDGLSLKAARMHMVEGMGQREAARLYEVDIAAVSRAVKKLTNIRICETCKQVVK